MKRKSAKNTKSTKYDVLPTLAYVYCPDFLSAVNLLKIYSGAPCVDMNLKFQGMNSTMEFFRYMCLENSGLSAEGWASTEIEHKEFAELVTKSKDKMLASFSEPVLNFYYYAKMINLADKNLPALDRAQKLKAKNGTIHWWITVEYELIHILYLINRIGRLSDNALKSPDELRKRVKEIGLYGEDVDFRSHQYRQLIPKLKFAGEKIWGDGQ